MKRGVGQQKIIEDHIRMNHFGALDTGEWRRAPGSLLHGITAPQALPDMGQNALI